MPVSTLSAAVHITPVVIKTFLAHNKRKGKQIVKHGGKSGEENAKDDILFDEAFHIVKAFIELATQNTVESLQLFTNTRVPSPFWAAVSSVVVPLQTCNAAADYLIKWFGPEEIKSVVGGERWWQIRGLDGVDAEWITQNDFLSDDKGKTVDGKKLSLTDSYIPRMEHLETVMLYLPGGGFYWGSINTHRYMIIRYARKIKGRAFAVNYRKAPQFPFPCAIQDILASYLYLIDPPPGALHKPIPPSKIVLAGDSAGGGLCLTLMTILRDLGLPLPAGGVLISPWVDLTHSFPSIVSNAATDIIPPHGFLAKPSTLWPVDPVPGKGGRIVPSPSYTNPPKPGHADTLKPDEERLAHEDEQADQGDSSVRVRDKVQTTAFPNDEESRSPNQEGSESLNDGNPTPDKGSTRKEELEGWEPRPPKLLMKDPNSQPLELRSQIQLYAMTEQLTNPLVSPLLQGSLGGLPPLYILAGDSEVLRDEVIYMAHRAAHPSKYPTRSGILKDSARQKENAEKFTTPTKVHLQVFDGMCHVLTVFSFTPSARYAFRSIAEFVKHVTTNSDEHVERNPFPELHRPPSAISSDSEPEKQTSHHRRSKDKPGDDKDMLHTRPPTTRRDSSTSSEKPAIQLYKENEKVAAEEVKNDQVDSVPPPMATEGEPEDVPMGEEEEDVANVLMLRERVDIYGQVRPMEAKEDMDVLSMDIAQIGLIKEEPALRWNRGQQEWDKTYRKEAENALKQRKKNEEKAQRLLDGARKQGLLHVEDSASILERTDTDQSLASESRVDEDRRWGPLDLGSESPPPTAIAGRRDTAEAIALLKKTIYWNAPVTHKTVPRQSTGEAIRAAFDTNDDPMKAPRQSAGEQENHKNHFIPIHGLRLWDGILSFMARKSTRKVARGGKKAAVATKDAVLPSR